MTFNKLIITIFVRRKYYLHNNERTIIHNINNNYNNQFNTNTNNPSQLITHINTTPFIVFVTTDNDEFIHTYRKTTHYELGIQL